MDVFFVLSGTVMAMLAERKPAPVLFLIKRAARIWPLYFICTTAALVLFLAGHKNMGLGSLDVAYVKSLFFIPTILPNWKITPLLFPAWTLYYEAFFYVLIAGFLAIARLWAVNLVTLALSIIVLFSLHFDFTGPALLLEFLLGILVWKFRPQSGVISEKAFGIVVVGSFLALCLFQYFDNSHLGGYYFHKNLYRVIAYAPVGAVIIWTSLGVNIQHSTSAIVSRVIKIGDESYALYLTHAFIVYMYVYISPIESRTFLAQTCVLATGLPISILLASQVHRYIDAPIQSALKKRLS